MHKTGLEGKIALVTGASRGIGRAIALTLAEEGAQVWLNYLVNAERAKETLQEIEKRGGKCFLLPFDVSDSKSVEESIKKIIAQCGKIDILVNNAGITRDGLLLRFKEEDWDAVMNINIKGMFLVTKAVSRYMVKARYGRIINISSVVAQGGREGQSAYCASKSAVEGFTKSLARELAKRNITVNAVAPGFIETELTAELDEKTRAEIFRQIPMQRFGSPEEVASAAAWLASDGASYITGAVIPVNGGIYM